MPSVASLMIRLCSGWCPAVGCDASCCGCAPPPLLVWLFEADVLVPNIHLRLDSLAHTTKTIVTIRPSSGSPTPPFRTLLIGQHISFLSQIWFTQPPFPCRLVQLVPVSKHHPRFLSLYLLYKLDPLQDQLVVSYPGPYLCTGPRGPGPGRQIFRGGILKKSRLKYGMRGKKRLSTREKFKGDLY